MHGRRLWLMVDEAAPTFLGRHRIIGTDVLLEVDVAARSVLGGGSASWTSTSPHRHREDRSRRLRRTRCATCPSGTMRRSGSADRRTVHRHPRHRVRLRHGEQRVQWHGLIAALESRLRLRKHRVGNLVKQDEYLCRRNGGMIGSLSQLIRGPAILAIEDGSEQITK
jgi:hypothetical protein